VGFEEEAPVDAEPMASTADLAMLGQCEAMQKIFEMIRRLAKTDVSVLITGESGTGKELCARAIHYHSTRRDQPFVPINCGAIPETLLESELFGYMKGAFTGAVSDKKGLIAAADKGTLFLDEIGDMPRHLQVKLLRFIEERSYQRLGDVESVHGDVRIVAATNKKDFAQEQGTSMRSDLYYRLSEFEIHLPPLRERGDDILLLAQGIVERHRHRFSLPKLALSTRAQSMLAHYSWPGNVRELENKLSRAAITCTNQIIEPDDLEFSVSSMGRLTLKEARDMFEREYVIAALKKAGNVISATAESLGISRPTLYDLMKKHGISIKTESTLEA
jgi:two-component system NtrC family response regulator